MYFYNFMLLKYFQNSILKTFLNAIRWLELNPNPNIDI